jgi:6-phosphogluconolactonase
MSELIVCPDAQALAEAAAEQLIALADTAITQRGRFSVALSGGSTPERLYQLLATPDYAGRIYWPGVHAFWGDERCVPPDHVDSCYRMAREALLDHVPIPPENIHRMQGELPPDEAATKYERLLHYYFGEEIPLPPFDLILLGMGDDGHTASLFPGTSAISEMKRWVIENYVPAKGMWRITLTRPVINAAANVTFLVSGSGKAARLRQVLGGSFDEDGLPAQSIQPTIGTLTWLVDQDAAAEL